MLVLLSDYEIKNFGRGFTQISADEKNHSAKAANAEIHSMGLIRVHLR
jgi:hypothetical protein